MPLRRSMHRFRHHKGGNIAMMTCLLAVPMIALLGGAVDVIRIHHLKKEVQIALDSGVLALSEIGNNSEPKETLEQFLASNLRDAEVDPDAVSLAVSVEKHLNRKVVNVSARYTIKTVFLGIVGFDEVDVALTSQGEQSFRDVEISLVLDISGSMSGDKFANMKTAAKDFIDTVLDESVIDKTSISIVPFSTTVNVGDDFKRFVRTSALDTDDDTNHSDGHYWHGCMELDDDDFDMDAPGIGTGEVFPTFSLSGASGMTACPSVENEAMYLSNDPDALKSMVEDLTISLNTGLDIGAAIGAKALAPGMRGRLSGDFANKRPRDFDSGTLKVLIVMTDGETTEQLRPDDGCDYVERRWFFVYYIHCGYQKYDAQANSDNFEDVCADAKQNDVIVYTIGFQIAKGANSDRILADCASNDSQYYYVESLNIGSAFDSIAASINAVRLTL